MLNIISDNNLEFLGFSFHVGSKCNSMKAHKNTIQAILDNYLDLCYAYGNSMNIQIIDIGGGFEFETQLHELHDELQEVLPKLEKNNIHLIAEPGRLFSQNTLDIYTSIIAIRERMIDGIPTLYLTLNDSVYHSFQSKIFDGQTFEPIAL